MATNLDSVEIHQPIAEPDVSPVVLAQLRHPVRPAANPVLQHLVPMADAVKILEELPATLRVLMEVAVRHTGEWNVYMCEARMC